MNTLRKIGITTLGVLCLAVAIVNSGARAARVENLYAVEVEQMESGGVELDEAFDSALRRVLVRVTGKRSVAEDAAVIRAFGDPVSLVQQYRIDPAGAVWVSFDQIAIKRKLDQLGQPFWGEQRPATLVWLVMDAGSGKREFLAAGSNLTDARGRIDPNASDRIAANEVAIRTILTNSAESRAVPLMLPLIDSAELAAISLSDVWGGFTESLVAASERYGADALLIGRARVFSSERIEVRWTLLVDGERYDWDGDVASGPHNIADFFAARLARSAGPEREIILQVRGVDDFNAYGRLSAYLGALEIVDDFSVKRVAGSDVLLSLSIRGDLDLLMRTISLQRVLQLVEDPVDIRANPYPDLGDMNPDLRYQLIAGS
jgi:hypothetical protein